MKKVYIAPLVFILAVYLWIPLLILADRVATALIGEAGLEILYPASLLFLLLTGIGNIISAVHFCKPEYRREMVTATIAVKYALIPFYIAGFSILLFMAMMTFTPVVIMAFLGPAFVIMGTIFGWLVLAFGSAFSVSYVIIRTKIKDIHPALALLHILTSFCFCLDTANAAWFSFREKRFRPLTIVLLVLTCIAIVAGFIGILLMIFGFSGS